MRIPAGRRPVWRKPVSRPSWWLRAHPAVFSSDVAYIELIQEEEAEGALAKVYSEARSRAGGVANIIKVMSRDAPALEASMSLYVNVMKAPNALSAARRELLAAVVSNVNDCYY